MSSTWPMVVTSSCFLCPFPGSNYSLSIFLISRTKDVPRSSCTFAILVLKLFIPSRSHGFPYWTMAFKQQDLGCICAHCYWSVIISEPSRHTAGKYIYVSIHTSILIIYLPTCLPTYLFIYPSSISVYLNWFCASKYIKTFISSCEGSPDFIVFLNLWLRLFTIPLLKTAKLQFSRYSVCLSYYLFLRVILDDDITSLGLGVRKS